MPDVTPDERAEIDMTDLIRAVQPLLTRVALLTGAGRVGAPARYSVDARRSAGRSAKPSTVSLLCGGGGGGGLCLGSWRSWMIKREEGEEEES